MTAKTPAAKRAFRSATGSALGRMNLRNVYANGQQVAGLDEAGKLDVLSRMTAFSNSESGRTQTVVQAGETLRNIAQRVYGNANLWYVIAAANALEGDGDLVTGTTLTVPEVKTSSNDASTFKPYNPGEITGPTSPGLPYIEPPSSAGCNPVMMILMAVVTVVVAVYAPMLAGAMSNVFGGATIATGAFAGSTIGGAMAASFVVGAGASAVAQGVGSVLGATSFSWRQVAFDGITSALTVGIGESLKGAGNLAKNASGLTYKTVDNVRQLTTFGRVASGVLSYGGSVVANAVVGRNTNFSWNGVAAAAMGAYGSAKLGGHLPALMERSSDVFGQTLIGSFVDGAVNATARRTMGMGKQNWGQIAMDAFGNALANAALQGIQSAKELKSLTPEQRADYDQMVKNGIPKQDALTYAQQTTTPLPAYLMRDVNKSPFLLNGFSSHPESSSQLKFIQDYVGKNGLDSLLNMGNSAESVMFVPGYEAWSDSQKSAYWNAFGQTWSHDSATGVVMLVAIREQLDEVSANFGVLAGGDVGKAAKLQEMVEVITAALLSKEVYFDRSIPELLPRGVTRVTDNAALRSETGLSSELLVNWKTGFFSAVYRQGDSGRYMIVNRGTDDFKKDFLSNALQAIGHHAPQYEQALEVARISYEKLGDRVNFAGHSLGGGLASAQAMAVRGQAITFNAAGLHANTVAPYNITLAEAPQHIRAYYLQGEILSYTQDYGKYGLAASATGVEALGNVFLGGAHWEQASLLSGRSVSELIASLPQAAGQRLAITPHEAPRLGAGNQGWLPGGSVMPLSRPYRTAELHGMSQMAYGLYGHFPLASSYRSASGWTPAPSQPLRMPAGTQLYWPPVRADGTSVPIKWGGK